MKNISNKAAIVTLMVSLLVAAGCTGEEPTTDEKPLGSVTVTQIDPDGTRNVVGVYGNVEDPEVEDPEVATVEGVKGMAFIGGELTPAPLTFPVGTKLQISNADETEHHAVGEGENCADLDSGVLAQTDTYEFEFTEEGECSIVDALNNDISGTVTVTAVADTDADTSDAQAEDAESGEEE